jgi:septum formation protein
VHATAQLGRMSGRSHRFISAAALVVNGVVHAQVLESATVHLWSLTAAEIADYVKTKEYSGSCGGYQIENRGARLIERVDGSLHAVLGLLFFGLLAALRTMAA